MCTWANCRRGLCWHIHVDISETFWWAAALADQCWVVNTAPCISCSTQTGLHSLAVCCCLPRLSYVLLTACAVQSLQQSDRADRPNSCTHRHMQYPFKLPFFWSYSRNGLDLRRETSRTTEAGFFQSGCPIHCVKVLNGTRSDANHATSPTGPHPVLIYQLLPHVSAYDWLSYAYTSHLTQILDICIFLLPDNMTLLIEQ